MKGEEAERDSRIEGGLKAWASTIIISPPEKGGKKREMLRS